MSVNSLMTSLADAIRQKSGKTGTMGIEAMTTAVQSIETGSTPVLQEKTVDPAEEQKTVSADSGYDGLRRVIVNPIDKGYIGSGVARKSSSDLTVSGATVSVPAGYYPSNASKAVATGTAGTPSASKGNVSNNQVTITPTVTNTTGYITGGTKNGTAVTVKASDLVSGSQTATENKTYDVTNLAELIVNVAGGGGGLPSGFSAIKYGTDTISTDFTTTRRTITHGLGVVPDFVLYWHDGNIATTYSMLWALRFSQLGHRSSAYDSFYGQHGNSSSTVSLTNSNSTTYGVSNLTTTTFQLASSSTSYFWRAGTYKWIAIKFS